MSRGTAPSCPVQTQEDGGFTLGGYCVSGEGAAAYGIGTSICYVSDQKGNTALLLTQFGTDSWGLLGASVLVGMVVSNGDIKDQEGPFNFFSLGGGDIVGAGASVAWGHGSECNCTVRTVFLGVGLSTPGIAFITGKSQTTILEEWNVNDPNVTPW
jgi:hypothetical protein